MYFSVITLIGDTRIGIWKCWFLRRGDNRSTRRKTSWSREDNQQQTQPTYDTGSGNRTRDILVGGDRSHHCFISVPSAFLRSLEISFKSTLCLVKNLGTINDFYFLMRLQSTGSKK